MLVGLAGATAQAQAPGSTSPASSAPAVGEPRWPNFPQQDHALAREIVGASHRNLERVTELLVAHPALANASYDWGFGDWESALGAASHVGRREIALVLLQHGARLDVFAAAMLGMVDVVKAILVAQPSLAQTRGPHGIPLLAHAMAGEDEATIEFLKSFEGATHEAPAPLKSEEMQPYLGTYASDASSEGGEVVITEARIGMMLQARGSSVRLTRTGEHTFHPAGARNVRVAFTVQQGAAIRVEIVEADWLVSASRAK